MELDKDTEYRDWLASIPSNIGCERPLTQVPRRPAPSTTWSTTRLGGCGLSPPPPPPPPPATNGDKEGKAKRGRGCKGSGGKARKVRKQKKLAEISALGASVKGYLPDHGRPKRARAHRRLARAVGQPPLPAGKQIPQAERKAAWNAAFRFHAFQSAGDDCWSSIAESKGAGTEFPPALQSAGDDWWSPITEGEGTEIESEGTELGTEWPAGYRVSALEPNLQCFHVFTSHDF